MDAALDVLTSCIVCASPLQPVRYEHSLVIAETTFVFDAPCKKCPTCQQEYLEGQATQRFELLVAAEIARSGANTADAIRMMITASGLDALELSGLLGVSAEALEDPAVQQKELGIAALDILALIVLDITKAGAQPSNVFALGDVRRPCLRSCASLPELPSVGPARPRYGAARHTLR